MLNRLLPVHLAVQIQVIRIIMEKNVVPAVRALATVAIVVSLIPPLMVMFNNLHAIMLPAGVWAADKRFICSQTAGWHSSADKASQDMRCLV